MSSIVVNQKRAFVAQAQDDAKRLCKSLANLSDAQRAAILALVTKRTSTPIDIHYVADTGDAELINEIVGGELITACQNTYLLGSGCDFVVTPAPGSETRYE